MKFIEAANEVLRINKNKPMSAKEIWSHIEKDGKMIELLKSKGKTPALSLSTIMLGASDNSNIKSKNKKLFYTIVSKNPIKFIRLENDSSLIEEDLDLSKEDIISKISELSSASLEINKCIHDNDFLCDILNNADKNYLHRYYNSDRSGVVIDIRKDVAKEVLLGNINTKKLLDIISSHKSKNTQQLKSWANAYKILHPLINYKYRDIDSFVEKFVKFLLKRIGGDLKYTICDFNGSQHQGSDKYWVAIYNSVHSSQSDGLQLFFEGSNGKFICGIYNYFEDIYLSKFEFSGDLEQLYDFIDTNSEIILNNIKSSKDNLLNRVYEYIESKDNLGSLSKDILTDLKLNITESTLKDILNNCDKFEFENEKYKIVDQIVGTGKLKKYLTEQGFITIENLVEILDKNGIKIKM